MFVLGLCFVLLKCTSCLLFFLLFVLFCFFFYFVLGGVYMNPD